VSQANTTHIGDDKVTTLNWTASSGHKITFEISAQFAYDLQGRRRTTGRKEIEVEATINGAVEFGGYLQAIDHPTLKGKFGRIGLTAENYDAVAKAIAAVEAEIAEHNAECDAHEAKLDAVDDASETLRRGMAHGEAN